MKQFKLIWKWRHLILALPKIVWFNFHYLPFRQAIRLPILLYKPRFRHCKGSIRLQGNVHFGQIKFGFPNMSSYPDTGIIWDNMGGTMHITNGANISIGNASSVYIHNYGHVDFRGDFGATAAAKIICCHQIKFGKNVLIGWDNLITDCDFHALTHINNRGGNIAFAPISIGDNVWIGLQTITLKGTCLPSNVVVAARTILNKDYTPYGEYVLLGGSPARKLKDGICWNPESDYVDYIPINNNLL